MLFFAEDVDVSGLTLHAAKRLEVEAQVRALELEVALQSTRVRLAALRKHHYRLAGEQEGWDQEQTQVNIHIAFFSINSPFNLFYFEIYFSGLVRIQNMELYKLFICPLTLTAAFISLLDFFMKDIFNIDINLLIFILNFIKKWLIFEESNK